MQPRSEAALTAQQMPPTKVEQSAVANKSRKRKGAKLSATSLSVPQKQSVNNGQQANEIKSSATSKLQTQTSTPPVLQQIQTNVPENKHLSSVKADQTKSTSNGLKPVKSFESNLVKTVIAKQVSEETDDIDAGIELDGSSNSGSSVKDMNDDQSKSTSVSPIMSQTKSVNQTLNDAKSQKSNNDPVEVDQVAKKISPTKQQLAANQQVIDADEQQLQKTLQNKQKKSLHISQDVPSSGGPTSLGSPQSPSLCKVCDQHVYQMERLLAEKAIYHKGCFRCYKCKMQLRVDNYSSHEGQVYCKAHHREIFRPQVKLDNEDDVDIVAKSRSQKKQLIICENEPAELPKDVIRCDTKVDDGFDRLNVNLNNILKKFESGTAANNDESQTAAPLTIEKPSVSLKGLRMAFESKSMNSSEDDSTRRESIEKPVVRKLNINGFLNRQNSTENDQSPPSTNRPTAVRRSESLMSRLKKFEQRIAGEQVDDESGDDENNNAQIVKNEPSTNVMAKTIERPKKLTAIKLWETGDINNKRFDDDEDCNQANVSGTGDSSRKGSVHNQEKDEELCRIRQQLARKKSGESGSIRNIYENAIKEAQQAQQSSKLNSGDLSALNGFSTTQIQQQLLQNNNQSTNTPTSPNKDHIQFNLNNKANRLKERFEQGLINNSSLDDSGQSDEGETPMMSKLEQIRQEKMEDLSVFTEGEIKAREARQMFQKIDKHLSASTVRPSLKSSATMKAKLMTRSVDITANNGSNHIGQDSNHHDSNAQPRSVEQQPIRLTNNVRM